MSSGRSCARPSPAARRLLSGAIGLLCLHRTIASIWTGHGPWWMWLLATTAQISALAARERAVGRFFTFMGERRGPSTPQERTRRRYVFAYTGVSVLAFAVGQSLLPPTGTAQAACSRAIAAVVLLIIAGPAALAGGWSAVWAFRSRDGSSRDPAAHQR